MTAEAAFTRAWSVGKYTCTLSAPRPKPGAVMCAVVEWDPHVPQDLSAAEWQQYRRGRNAALADLAAEFGVVSTVVDL